MLHRTSDVDGVGVICEPCYERGYPPHFSYLSRLLSVEWPIATIIARYAFAACAKTERYQISEPVRSLSTGSPAPSGSNDNDIAGRIISPQKELRVCNRRPVGICLAPAGSAGADGQPAGGLLDSETLDSETLHGSDAGGFVREPRPATTRLMPLKSKLLSIAYRYLGKDTSSDARAGLRKLRNTGNAQMRSDAMMDKEVKKQQNEVAPKKAMI